MDFISNIFRLRTIPVSYTHLDVYKRQHLFNRVSESSFSYSFYYSFTYFHQLSIPFISCSKRFFSGSPSRTPISFCVRIRRSVPHNRKTRHSLSLYFQFLSLAFRDIQYMFIPVSYTHLDVYKRQVSLWSPVLCNEAKKKIRLQYNDVK